MTRQPDDQQPEKAPGTAPRPVCGFAAGTPIRTPTGSTPVEAVKPGDVVAAPPRPDPRWFERN